MDANGFNQHGLRHNYEHGFRNFDHGAADVVLAVAFNSSGTRIALGSADHKIRVYDVEEDETSTLVDQWRGHDAEVMDASFPDLPEFSILRQLSQGQMDWIDLRTCICNHVAYISFDFKTIKHEVWLVLITRDGLLSLLEPSEPESLSVWKEIDTMYPFGQHSRGTEPRFTVSLHQSERPCYNAVIAGLDPKALSLAVSAMNLIKIFRAVKPDEGSYQFHEMVELATDAPMINDISWAPGCIRPCDLIAVACDDGSVCIFEVNTPHTAEPLSVPVSESRIPAVTSTRENTTNSQNAPSGIGAGLAGVSRAARDVAGITKVSHEWKKVAVLSHSDNSAVWKVRWVHDGSALASTGDTGKLHLWKQNLAGQFIEFAETGPE
ncbi:epoxide hydrolase, soluble (sEH) [Lobaria immixta]|nr:epoxide hydrolase, soluble (sEH) [Lobaria immixta]